MRIQITFTRIAALLILTVAATSGTLSNSATIRAQTINASTTIMTLDVLIAAGRNPEATGIARDAEETFEFDGYYVISGAAPRGFENLADVPQQIGGNTKSAYGHIETRAGTDFKFTAITVSREKITFTTRSIRGISYKFEGRFLTDKPTKAPADEVVLEGTLVKLQTGKQIASADIRLTYFPGD